MEAVLSLAQGQDAVMLLAYLQTGARKSELFKLTWDDVDLENKRIRLMDSKGKNGTQRVRWQSITDDLAGGLLWWQEHRSVVAHNVFMQISNHMTKNPKTGEKVHTQIGDPFRTRQHFMKNLCKRAGVKAFGFHVLHHKGARLLYTGASLDNVQLFMGHANPTQTDRYIKSSEWYIDKSKAVEVIMESNIGKIASGQLKKVMASELESQKPFCKQSPVNR